MRENTAIIYELSADFYDLIYAWKDYASEAQRIRTVLAEFGIHRGARVVEAACGTGSYLAELQEYFELSGFDLSDEMLRLARTKVPGVSLFKSDMAAFELERPVDALLCLFSAIGYIYPLARLRQLSECFYRNLLPGGLVLIDPWIEPSAALDGQEATQTYSSDELTLSRTGTLRVDGRLSHVDFEWRVERPSGVEHFKDAHSLYLYTKEEISGAFDEAGFETQWHEVSLMPGRNLLVARKRP